MKRVYLDSCVVIYLIEGPPQVRAAVATRLSPGGSPGFQFFCSDLTRMECRVGPLKLGNPSALAEFDDFFSQAWIRQIPLSTAAIDLATELRATHNLKTPDALHAAAAMTVGCDEFWTNDRQFNVLMPRIQVEILP